MSATLPYRPDIDGLRALAVVPVVFFHMGLENIFGGGYVGVDIFFVISGFLITSIIHRDIQSGQFTLSGFYERRILRILPALFLVLAVSTVIAWFVLLPKDLAYFGQTLAATTGFSSNILFWFESGYFSPDAAYVPLLHTWSLAVEEQFYIFFPLILMLLVKVSTKVRIMIVAVLFLASLMLSVAFLSSQQSFVFYMLPTRAWELLAGSLLALMPSPKFKSNRVMQSLSVLGIGLISFAVLAYDDGTDFPGLAALIPVLGAVLLIYTGMHGVYAGQRLLTTKPAIFFGKISYSLYLWHWPLIVFFTYGTPWELIGIWVPVLFAACVGLSYLSWRYVEQPLRTQTMMSGVKLFICTGILCIFFAALGMAFKWQGGIPSRFNADILRLATQESNINLPRIENIEPHPGYSMVVGAPEATGSFMVWGDSHAGAAIDGLHALALEQEKSGYLFGYHSCFPSVTVMDDMEPLCNELNARHYDFLRKHPEIKNVVLIARWHAYENRMQRRKAKGREAHELPFDHYLGQTIKALHDAGKKVFVMTEVPPAPSQSINLYLVRQVRYAQDQNLYTDLPEYLKTQEKVSVSLNRLSGLYDFSLIEPHKTMCSDGKCPLMGDGRSYYYDDDHISGYGATHFKAMFRLVFSDM